MFFHPKFLPERYPILIHSPQMALSDTVRFRQSDSSYFMLFGDSKKQKLESLLLVSNSKISKPEEIYQNSSLKELFLHRDYAASPYVQWMQGVWMGLELQWIRRWGWAVVYLTTRAHKLRSIKTTLQPTMLPSWCQVVLNPSRGRDWGQEVYEP